MHRDRMCFVLLWWCFCLLIFKCWEVISDQYIAYEEFNLYFSCLSCLVLMCQRFARLLQFQGKQKSGSISIRPLQNDQRFYYVMYISWLSELRTHTCLLANNRSTCGIHFACLLSYIIVIRSIPLWLNTCLVTYFVTFTR
jgi:hypothetical protein